MTYRMNMYISIPMTQAITILEPDDDLGPSMAALTENQRRFVYHMLITGGANATNSARAAGYSDGKEGDSGNPAGVAGYRLAHSPKILAAMKEEGDRRLRGGVVLGASVLIEIAGDVLHKDRYKAACRLLDQAGLGIEHKQTIEVKHTVTEEAKIEEVRKLALQLGLDPRQLLGQAGIIDAEFTEVSDDDLWTIEPEATA